MSYSGNDMALANQLYNFSYYPKFPVTFCDGPFMLNVNGTCTDMRKFTDDMRDDAQSSGACPMMNKQLGTGANAVCVPTNENYATPVVGFYGMGTQSVQFGPKQQFTKACCYGGEGCS